MLLILQLLYCTLRFIAVFRVAVMYLTFCCCCGLLQCTLCCVRDVLRMLYCTLRSVAVDIRVVVLYFTFCCRFRAAVLYFVSACVLTSGAQPLYFEITCENLFPVSEAIVSGSLSLLLNVASTVFLLLAMIPGMGKTFNGSSQL